MKVAAYQRCVVCWRLCRKIFEQIVTVAYLCVISFTEREKETATEAYLEPSQGFFTKTVNALNSLALKYFRKKLHHRYLTWL